MKKTLASDNYAGILPGILQALEDASPGHETSYGHDTYTQLARKEFEKLFGKELEMSFVFNGTGANVLGISCAVSSFHSIFCPQISHINVDESTAPETFTSCRIYPLPCNADGKIEASTLAGAIIRKGDEHHPQPAVLTISQPTEYGTLYTVKELQEISEILKQHQMVFHVDSARFFNALSATGLSASEMFTETGVDIISVGGTKAGLLFGEAVVFLNTDLAKNLKYKQKQSMQLPSKMRFISAQFHALLSRELWKESSAHANAMAKRLEAGLRSIEGVKITKPVETNAVFVIFPESIIPALQDFMFFYMWKDATGEARLMCSFDTSTEEVDAFVGKIKSLIHFS
jgi:threonine aldolase